MNEPDIPEDARIIFVARGEKNGENGSDIITINKNKVLPSLLASTLAWLTHHTALWSDGVPPVMGRFCF